MKGREGRKGGREREGGGVREPSPYSLHQKDGGEDRGKGRKGRRTEGRRNSVRNAKPSYAPSF